MAPKITSESELDSFVPVCSVHTSAPGAWGHAPTGDRIPCLKPLKRCCSRHLCRHTGDPGVISLSVTSIK